MSTMVCTDGKSRVGARCVLAILCCLAPAYFVLVLLPVYPLYMGHVKVPQILLSNIMSAHPTYQSLYILGFGVPLLVITFLMTQVCQHLRGCGVCASALNAFLFCVTVPSGIGLLMLLGFNFEDESGVLHGQNSLHNVLHLAGTMTYFAGAGVACWIYTNFVQPEAEKLKAIHPSDLSWGSILGKQLVIGTCSAVVVRAFHITWPITWAIPMLVVECYLIGLAVSICILGNFRSFMHLDAIDPLIDLSFLTAQEKGGSTQLTAKLLSVGEPGFVPNSHDKIPRRQASSSVSTETEAEPVSDDTDEASDSYDSEVDRTPAAVAHREAGLTKRN